MDATRRLSRQARDVVSRWTWGGCGSAPDGSPAPRSTAATVQRKFYPRPVQAGGLASRRHSAWSAPRPPGRGRARAHRRFCRSSTRLPIWPAAMYAGRRAAARGEGFSARRSPSLARRCGTANGPPNRRSRGCESMGGRPRSQGRGSYVVRGSHATAIGFPEVRPSAWRCSEGGTTASGIWTCPRVDRRDAPWPKGADREGHTSLTNDFARTHRDAIAKDPDPVWATPPKAGFQRPRAAAKRYQRRGSAAGASRRRRGRAE